MSTTNSPRDAGGTTLPASAPATAPAVTVPDVAPAGSGSAGRPGAPAGNGQRGPAGNGRRRAPAALRALASVWRLWFFAALIVAWWLASASSSSPYFPPLSEILHRLVDLWITGDSKKDLVPSLEHFAIGYAMAGAIGVVGGALLWYFRHVRDAITPLLYFVYVIPSAAILPAIIAVLGIGNGMKIAIIVLASVWPTLLNTVDGMRGVDPLQLDTARVLHMSPLRTVRSVVLPAALPQIMAGLRNSLQISIIMMVVSELVASTSGIGFFILDAQQRFAITDMWTGIIVLAVVGSLLTLVFVAVERLVLGWYIGARAVEGKR
ncbi:ABC transporter permease [Rugosimonospora africana]|uniref:Nitrate ABC transporter permease n=1 Tax=Rugosimonospora africana TaxID=556532 RepID=A0A8J3VQP1_9ACTN|nr:ABC transporter permease [Rugosimonospora africana]GIH15340.1 nitrate ABC transporter permease [Rugosimonospora africana]